MSLFTHFIRPWLPITRNPLPHMTGQLVRRVVRRWRAPWEPMPGDPLGFRGGIAYAAERGPTSGPTHVRQIIARRVWSHGGGAPPITPNDVVTALLERAGLG